MATSFSVGTRKAAAAVRTTPAALGTAPRAARCRGLNAAGRALTFVLAGILAGCASGPKALYPGPERPSEEVAILTMGDDEDSCRSYVIQGVDGQTAWLWNIALLPGPHEIYVWRDKSVGATMGLSAPIWLVSCAGDEGPKCILFDVELKAGHEYGLVRAGENRYELHDRTANEQVTAGTIVFSQNRLSYDIRNCWDFMNSDEG